MANKINDNGLLIIKQCEGFSATPYLCPAGKPTIGYGHLIREHEKLLSVTMEQAEDLLIRDVEQASSTVRRLIRRELNDNQFSALVSFVYNVGGGNFQASTLKRVVNEGRDAEVPAQLNRWVYAAGKKQRGLVLRRQLEANLYMKGLDDGWKEEAYGQEGRSWKRLFSRN